jgi:uncharacterized membrane protein YjdF
MKSDKNIFLLKIALVAVALIIFANQYGHRDALSLAGVLATIPLVFVIDLLEYLTKRKFSHALQIAYLFFILIAAIIGNSLMVYSMGAIYDKVVHFCSGALTVFAARELYGKEIANQRAIIKFFFYVGIAALIAVAWETYEFLIDQLFSADMQRAANQSSITDTMIDMIAALAGAIGAWVFLNWTKRKI